MEGFVYKENGKPIEIRTVRIKEFITGKAKMQVKQLGVVELEDGTVRCFYVHHDHNPDFFTGKFRVVGQALPQNFDATVKGLRDFESQWITEELDERATY